jgi:ABC-type transport system involved in cytochrome bd biosynthesis fused ATPase/permease subunit
MSGDGSERTPESTDDPTDGGTFLLGEGGLETVEEDAFGHRAHVRTLEDIVNRVETPWHVALYGTWGSGKSTIIDLLYKRIRASQESVSAYADVDTENIATRNDFENTLCVKFNAWKHAEDSIRTELLLDLN